MGARGELLALFNAAAPGSGEFGTVLADAVIAAGWRPTTAATLISVEDLDALVDYTVIADRDGSIWQVNERHEWCEMATAGLNADEIVQWAPFTIVLAPTVDLL